MRLERTSRIFSAIKMKHLGETLTAMKINTRYLKDKRENMRTIVCVSRSIIPYLCAQLSSFPAIYDDIEKFMI